MRLLLFLLFSALLVAPGFAEVPAKPDAKARCEVCGMFVAPYPNWLAVLTLQDGRRFYFDGPKDLFIFYADPAKYQPGIHSDQGAELFVTDYYTTRLLAATEVYFVAGSDVRGPMGVELVPVAGLEAAEIFRRDHGGSKLMRFDGRELQEVAEQP